MTNISMRSQGVEGALHAVIANLVDGEKGYKKIGEAMQNNLLKRYFLAESMQCAQFRNALESLLHHEGLGELDGNGTMSGVIRRAWIGLQVAIGEGDHSLLLIAEQAETEASQAYRDALSKELVLPVRELLFEQLAHIDGSLEYLRAARDSSNRAAR